jgi:hypothetical protein
MTGECIGAKRKGRRKKGSIERRSMVVVKKDHDAAKNVGMKYQEESSGRNGGNNRHILTHPTAKRKKYQLVRVQRCGVKN